MCIAQGCSVSSSRRADRTPARTVSTAKQGGVAEWLCSGLQSRVRRFDSDPRLHIDFAARVVKLVDTTDLKSVALQRAYRFESGSGHQSP